MSKDQETAAWAIENIKKAQESLQKAWDAGDFPGIKQALRDIQIDTNTVERVLKQQLYDNL